MGGGGGIVALTSMPRKQFTEEEILRILRLRAIGKYPTVRALCAEHGISPARLRGWRQLEERLTWELEDWVRSALVVGAATVEDMISWIDWRNHMLYTREEVSAELSRLAARGAVCAEAGGRWRLVEPWP